MQAGATQIHLMWVDEPVVAPRGHVAVVAPDYDAVVGALRAAGFEVEPRTEHWGARAVVRARPRGAPRGGDGGAAAYCGWVGGSIGALCVV